MKKLLPLCIIGIVVLSGLGAVAQTTSEYRIETTMLNFSEPNVQTKNTYASVFLQEANSFIMQQGKPLLPSYIETYTFPFKTIIKSVLVTPRDITIKTIVNNVEPTPRQVLVGEPVTIANEEQIQYGDEPYPTSWFTYRVGCGLYDGTLSTIVTVEVYPIQYHPAEKILKSAKEATVVIEYTTPSPEPASTRDNYQLVVIGPAEFSSQIAPLITHKTGAGITSRFVSLEDIYAGTYFPATGRDNQEKIKYFIKNAIETWLTGSILLVGGQLKLPTRTTHVYIDDEEPSPEVFVSDLYYADIYNSTGGFCSWDSNANDIFGEYQWEGKTDQVDLHPDVYLARLAATSTSQVTTCVNKIKQYETTPGYQQSWFPKVIAIGGDSHEDDDDIDEGEYTNQKVIDVMTGFASVKLWVTNGMLTGLAPTGLANIKDSINDGAGFVAFSGHGNPQAFATHPHTQFALWVPTPFGNIKNSDVQSLTNGNKLPIVTVEACSTSKFNSDSNCFNWAFLSNANGGGIGSFGATALGWGYVGTGTTQGLIGKMGLDTYKAYKLDKATTFGEMWTKALNRYIKPSMQPTDYKVVEEWIAFGDPSLAIAEESQAPAKPATPTGTTSGNIKTEYEYSSSTTDPDGDKVSYMFDWGDGTFSSWVGPVNSGVPASAKKTWTVKGTYSIKVVSKDEHGVLSEWSDPLPVTMPLAYEPPFLRLLEKLFEWFPNAFPLLRQLLGYN
ncbi:MAG: hypothetical protein JW840_10110 [Candidatus Thermoplasmatota archaeon]|nr:hypothetical protein [Candidatus Thermoplasmatota archaeon]